MVVFQPRSPEPLRSTRRGRGACPWSSRERTFKARTAFLVAPLAKVDGECMGLDGPALISTCCHSALAARAATGAPTVTAVTLRIVREYLCVPFRATGFELDVSEVSRALLALSGVREYARIFLSPTQSLTKVRTSMCAVRASRMNDLAVTVSIPRVQQAPDALCQHIVQKAKEKCVCKEPPFGGPSSALRPPRA